MRQLGQRQRELLRWFHRNDRPFSFPGDVADTRFDPSCVIPVLFKMRDMGLLSAETGPVTVFTLTEIGRKEAVARFGLMERSV